MKNPIKLAILCTAVCAAMLAFTHNANATALTIEDGYTIGEVFFGIPSGDVDRQTYVNDVVYAYNLGLPAYAAHGQTYTMFNLGTYGTSLPNAIWALNSVGGSNSFSWATAGTYNYLFAKYDGPNQGSVVWYVGNLTSFTIPTQWNGYGLSGWTLFGPGGAGAPDGGTTVMLLGAALGALGMARRFLKR
jgi:hypothetical protein